VSPLVSVVMAVHNEADFIHEALQSITLQSFGDFEFIILDDASADETPSILEKYQQCDSRIRLMRLGQNLGLTACLNRSIELVRGKYIARMDADDISLPQRLEKQVEFMESHPEVDVLGTGFALIDEAGARLSDVIFSSHPQTLKWNLPFFTPIAHPSAMIRTETIKRLGGYDPDMKRAQDYDLWWRVSLSGRLANLSEIHLLLRQHAKNISTRYQDQQEYFSRVISAKYLSLVLRRSISEDLVEHMRGKRTTSQMAACAVEAIIDYARLCLSDSPFDVATEIMKDAWGKSMRKIARFVIFPVTWRAVFHLLHFLFSGIVIVSRTQKK
jgi:glycosyltransferase involved in cell wall biosynthesis